MKNPYIEALKEVARWLIAFLVSAAIAQISSALKLGQVPERFQLGDVAIPLRLIVEWYALPALIRAADKFKFEIDKLNAMKTGEVARGLFQF